VDLNASNPVSQLQEALQQSVPTPNCKTKWLLRPFEKFRLCNSRSSTSFYWRLKVSPLFF